MLAAVLEAFRKPLMVKEVSDPRIGSGEVMVDVLADLHTARRRRGVQRSASISAGTAGDRGSRRHRPRGYRRHPTRPAATRLRPGDLVWCDATVRSRDDAVAPDITWQGWRRRTDAVALIPRRALRRAAAGALRWPAGRGPAGRRDRARQRRDGKLRQCGRGRRAGHGCGRRRLPGPQPGGSWTT